MKKYMKKLLNLVSYNIKSINKLYFVFFISIFLGLEYYVRVINSVYSNKEAFDIFFNSFKVFNDMSLILIEIIICAYVIAINEDKKNILVRMNDYSVLLNANGLSVIILNFIIIGIATVIIFVVSLAAANFNIDIKYFFKHLPQLKIALYFILIFIFMSSFYGLIITILYKITRSKKITILFSFLYSFNKFFIYPFMNIRWIQFLFIDYQLDLSTIINLHANAMNKYYISRVLYCLILFESIIVLYIILSNYKVLGYKEKKSIKH